MERAGDPLWSFLFRIPGPQSLSKALSPLATGMGENQDLGVDPRHLVYGNKGALGRAGL